MKRASRTADGTRKFDKMSTTGPPPRESVNVGLRRQARGVHLCRYKKS
jgi:hypothetical protein